MQFTIPATALRAVELFAAKNDVRYYLNGIYVRTLDKDTLQVVATTGHILGQYRHARDASADAPYTPGEEALLPRDMLAGLKLSKYLPNVTITVVKQQWILVSAEGQRSGTLIDGKFPDMDRVWPTQIVSAPGNYDFKILALIQKAADVLGVKYPRLFQAGASGSGMFKCGGDFAGVIMPWRTDAEELPDWCRTTISGTSDRLVRNLAIARANYAVDAPEAPIFDMCATTVGAAIDANPSTFLGMVQAEAAIIRGSKADVKKALWADSRRSTMAHHPALAACLTPAPKAGRAKRRPATAS